jgi:glycosyltransferase involved in cell wall biosynthesis
MPSSQLPRQFPTLSVVIPTFNRRDTAVACACALLAQRIEPEKLEIIFVDDGSTDGTSDLMAMLAEDSRISLVCLRQPNAGANAARNHGLQHVKSELVAFLNDDSIASPALIAEHIRQHRLHPSANVAVLGSLLDSDQMQKSVFTDLHRNPRFDRLAEGAALDWTCFFTYNISLKTSFLKDLTFNPSLRWHEDVELGYRLARKGLKIVFAPAAEARHLHPLSEQDYFAMADRDGAALADWFRQSPDAKPDLVPLGLRSWQLRNRKVRHALADAVIQPENWPGWLGLARKLARISPEAAKALYRRLYQWRARQAISNRLAGPWPQ